MPRRLYSDDEINDIKNLYLNGLSTVKIAKKYNKTPSAIAQLLNKNNIKLRSNKENNRKYFFDFDFFETIDTEEKAYWLGFLYADGYISNTKYNQSFGISLSIDDKSHLCKFSKSIKSNYPINIYNNNSSYSSKPYCRVLLRSQKTVNDLIRHGVLKNKTNILKPPKYISSKLIHHFIRGYIDGDGCITYYTNKNGKKECKIKICGTVDMLTFLKKFFEENCYITVNKFYKRNKSHIVQSIDI